MPNELLWFIKLRVLNNHFRYKSAIMKILLKALSVALYQTCYLSVCTCERKVWTGLMKRSRCDYNDIFFSKFSSCEKHKHLIILVSLRIRSNEKHLARIYSHYLPAKCFNDIRNRFRHLQQKTKSMTGFLHGCDYCTKKTPYKVNSRMWNYVSSCPDSSVGQQQRPNNIKKQKLRICAWEMFFSWCLLSCTY